jgi:hypothetical protein
MSEISIQSETSATIEDTAPKIRVENFAKGEYIPGRSWMVVGYDESDATIKRPWPRGFWRNWTR